MRYNKKTRQELVSRCGLVSEKLGSGLQNRSQGCDSPPGLKAGVMELLDIQDLKSCGGKPPCGLESRLRHQSTKLNINPSINSGLW